MKSAVRIETGIVEDNVEGTVAQRSTRRREIEVGDCVGVFIHGLAVLRVKPQCVGTECKGSSLELLEDILIFEQ